MLLKITFKDTVYTANVLKEGHYFRFILIRENEHFAYYVPYSFYHFNGSLQSRLKYYRRFKEHLFANPYRLRSYVE